MNTHHLITIKNNFVTELQRANKGQKTSLPFIRHEPASQSLVKDGELFQVLVVGGSISKKALVKKQGKDLRILEVSQKNQSPFKSKEAFLSFIEQGLSDSVTTLSLNLAYPLKPVFNNSKLEGILLSGTKENTFNGLIDKNMCKEIEKHILTKKKRKIQVTAANDTVCLLLSGLTQLPYNQLACGIVGTGVNFAFFLDRYVLVNLEAANFDKFPQTEEGKEIDKNSSLPKRALFEKETSGAYLYKHFNLQLHKKHLPIISIDDTKELTILAQETHSLYSQISRQILYSSSELVATQIAGISEFLNRDLTFVMEGSLFWEGFEYKTHLEQTLSKIHNDKQISFKHIHNSYIVGAAQLACPQI